MYIRKSVTVRLRLARSLNACFMVLDAEGPTSTYHLLIEITSDPYSFSQVKASNFTKKVKLFLTILVYLLLLILSRVSNQVSFLLKRCTIEYFLFFAHESRI
jgi:hypothetical protein